MVVTILVDPRDGEKKKKGKKENGNETNKQLKSN